MTGFNCTPRHILAEDDFTSARNDPRLSNKGHALLSPFCLSPNALRRVRTEADFHIELRKRQSLFITLE